MEITGITVWQKTLPLTKPYWLSGGRLKFEALDSTFRPDRDPRRADRLGRGLPVGGDLFARLWRRHSRWRWTLLAPVLARRKPWRYRALSTAPWIAGLARPSLRERRRSTLPFGIIAGKRAGAPLFELFGGAEGAEAGVAVNSSISTGTPEEMVALINAARAQGLPHPLRQGRRG